MKPSKNKIGYENKGISWLQILVNWNTISRLKNKISKLKYKDGAKWQVVII